MTAMRSLSASALALGAKGAALTVALALAFAFLPVVSLAVVPFLPLPTAYVCLRQGGMAAAISAAAASLMAGIISGATGSIDQVLAQPSDPRLEEPYVRDASA